LPQAETCPVAPLARHCRSCRLPLPPEKLHLTSLHHAVSRSLCVAEVNRRKT